MADTQSTDWKLIIFIAVLFAALIALAIYQHNLLLAKNAELQSAIIEQKKIVGEVVRSQTSLATKEDLDNRAKQLGLQLEPIKKDIESLGGKIQGINSVVADSHQQVMAGVVSTSKQVLDLKASLKNKNNETDTKPIQKPVEPATVLNGVKLYPDPYGYMSTIQELQLNEEFSKVKVPFGKVGFAASLEKPWYVDIPPRKYSIANVVSVNKQGRHNIYNRLSVTTLNKTYEIPIDNAQYQEIYPSSEFSFNPRLYLGIGAGTMLAHPELAANASLEVSLFSWGQTDIDLYWRILGIGLGYDFLGKNAVFTLTPAAYNIGKHIPLMQNLFIGPQIAFTPIDNNFSIFIGLSGGL